MDYQKLFDMTGKVCVVMGGAGHLGTENSKILQDFGGTVIVTGTPTAKARWEARETKIGQAFYLCNNAEDDSVRECFRNIAQDYGRIDVLVCCTNARRPLTCESNSFLEYMANEEFETLLANTCGAAFRSIREVVPYMKDAGGSIITYCSMYGLVSPDLRIYGDSHQRQGPAYGAGKAAELQLTKYAACDLAKYHIRVNCVTPGPFPAPRNQDNETLNGQFASHTMLGRFGQSYEIAGAVLLLASDAGSFMTGTNIVVDGGWTAW